MGSDENLVGKDAVQSPRQRGDELFMPAEWAPHEGCVMSFCAASGMFPEWQVDEIRFEQARIANAIAAFEPVFMLANANDAEEARQLCGTQVGVVEMQHYDMWTRDTLPTICFDRADRSIAICWNFNVWGEKLEGYDADRDLACRFAAWRSLPMMKADIVAEGGAFDVDGEGTLLTTQSCIQNPNRNPNLSIGDIEGVLRRLTGVDKIIWLPGSATGITDGHVDGMARFARPGIVVADISDDPLDPEYEGLLENAKALSVATDCSGRALEVIFLKRPRWDVIRARADDFSASYANCYFANGAVILPKYGDPIRDDEAREVFVRLMPDRKIVQVGVHEISEGGGGVHCVTQQIPKAHPSQAKTGI